MMTEMEFIAQYAAVFSGHQRGGPERRIGEAYQQLAMGNCVSLLVKLLSEVDEKIKIRL